MQRKTLSSLLKPEAYSHYSLIGKFELLGFCNATSLSYVLVKEATRFASERKSKGVIIIDNSMTCSGICMAITPLVIF